MDIKTSRIITGIANIQISALNSILDNEKNPNKSLAYEITLDLLEVKGSKRITKHLSKLIKEETKNRIDLYKQLIEYPQLINTLDEYQILTCIHILWRMESTWVIGNPEGVQKVWKILLNAQTKFHPEFSLLKV